MEKSNNSIRVEEKVEIERFAMSVDAGQGAQDIVGILSFDRSKGTVKIACHLTTKHINLNDDENRQIVLDDFRMVAEKAVYAAIPKIKEYLESQDPNPGQRKLFEGEESKDETTVISGHTVEKPVGKKKRNVSKVDDEKATDDLASI